MAGSDVPSGFSNPSTPGTPSTSRKRARGSDYGAAEPSASPSAPRRVTRSSSRLEVEEALQWARSVAVGRWPQEDARTKEEERLEEVVLGARKSLCVPKTENADIEDYPYSQKKLQTPGLRKSPRIANQLGHLSSYLLVRKRIGIDSTVYQACVPEWKDGPSEKDTAGYNTDPETLQKMGTVVRALDMDISANDEANIGKARIGNCNCSSPGSVICVRVHVREAKTQLKDNWGQAFKDSGLHAMGEDVLKLWTAKDKKKLRDVEKMIPENKHKNFLKMASRKLSSKKKGDLAGYYYNVFLPRRLANLTRAEPANSTNVDTDDEIYDVDDDDSDVDNNEHHSEEKSRHFGSPSQRPRT